MPKKDGIPPNANRPKRGILENGDVIWMQGVGDDPKVSKIANYNHFRAGRCMGGMRANHDCEIKERILPIPKMKMMYAQIGCIRSAARK